MRRLLRVHGREQVAVGVDTGLHIRRKWRVRHHRLDKGRGARLHETPDTFSGLFWNGADAVNQGLADHFGNLDYVAREVVKAEDVVDYTPRENVAERFLREIRVDRIWEGTSEIQRLIIARSLLKRGLEATIGNN